MAVLQTPSKETGTPASARPCDAKSIARPYGTHILGTFITSNCSPCSSIKEAMLPQILLQQYNRPSNNTTQKHPQIDQTPHTLHPRIRRRRRRRGRRRHSPTTGPIPWIPQPPGPRCTRRGKRAAACHRRRFRRCAGGDGNGDAVVTAQVLGEGDGSLEVLGRAGGLDDGQEGGEEALVAADAGDFGDGAAGVGEGGEGGAGSAGGDVAEGLGGGCAEEEGEEWEEGGGGGGSSGFHILESGLGEGRVVRRCWW